MPPVTLEPLRPEHRDAARAIYAQGIDTGDATFETDAPDWEAWNASHLPGGRIVAREEGEGVGWAALAPVSSRCVYGGVAEVSVYVARGSSRERGRVAAARG